MQKQNLREQLILMTINQVLSLREILIKRVNLDTWEIDGREYGIEQAVIYITLYGDN